MSFEVLRLHANQEAHALDTQLIDNHAASNAKELFLTNCILADPDDLYRSVRSCSELQALRCVASTLRPCDLLTLMLKRLPHLMEVELSLVSETGVAWEIGNIEEIASQNPDAKAYNLCLMYVEIGGTQNLQLLKVLLNFCPNLTRLHVHFVSGNLGKAIAECRCILEARPRLKTFTFSSEMTPTSIEFRPVGPLGFSSYANFCANVTYQRSPKSWSCAQLRDVAHNWKEGRTMPTQLVLVAIDDEDLMVEWIRMACHRHIWTFVRHLCILKFPAELSSANKQTGAGTTYHDTLRHFFSTAAKNVVELNVSSFHFGPDLDLTQLFLRDALKFLQSLSVSPCGLSHPLALKRLAQSCPGIEDLDLRVDRRGGLIWCSICESEFRFEAEQMRLFWRTGPYSRNQRQLARLTLCDLPKLASLQFLERCNVTTLRLSNCLSPLHADYMSLGRLLARNGELRFLLLRDDALPLGETSLLANLSLIDSLEYLCLLSAKPVSNHVACKFVLELADKLSQLECLHVHYRVAEDAPEQRVTWIRREGAASGGDAGSVLIRNCACVLCSTATFIGLVKPRNRDLRVGL